MLFHYLFILFSLPNIFSTKLFVEKNKMLTLYLVILFVNVHFQSLVKYIIVCQITNVRMPLLEMKIFSLPEHLG